MGLLRRSLLMSLKDPALNSRWYCFIGGDTSNLKNKFMVVAEMASLPSPSTPAMPRQYGGMNRYYAGVKDFPPMSLTLYETHDFEAKRYLEEWRGGVVSDKGIFGLPRDYKRPVTIEQYSGQSSDMPVRTLTYEECWPTDEQPQELNYTEVDGRLVISIELANHGYTVS